MQRGKEAKRQSEIKYLPPMRQCIYVSMRLFTIYYVLFSFLSMPVLAFELDTSIDADIRKNYNPTKIEEDAVLPVLPKILNEKNAQPTANARIQSPQAQGNPLKEIQYSPSAYTSSVESYATLKHGTKIKVKLLSPISDRSKKGTQVSFISKYPVTTTYFTIPTGTVFKGEILESHKPQFTGNGGLIVINVDSVIINNEIHPIKGVVVKAGSKKIFFNNIKGKRRYINSAFKSMAPGGRFFQKMFGLTLQLTRGGSEILLTPFSLGIGTIGLGGNILAAPLIAVFYKGDSVSLPEGTNFEIKLTQDVFIYN